jgi:sugar phosphate isomerase/epimerase
LFNEADAIFGIRKSGAEGAVDKMENSLQNIILQEMEDLKGILIATTNLTENLDKAFERRFLYKVKFSNPSVAVKCQIWNSMMPELPEADAHFLAENFDFSGGQIENVVRKKTIQTILTGQETEMDTLMTFCCEEMIGAKNLIIHGISYNGDNAETQDDIDELNFKLYSSLIPTLRECNVTVCLENLFTRYKNGRGTRRTIYAGHCSDPYDAVAEIDMLNDLAGKECFGLCLDTGHLNLVGIPVKKYISILGSRIKCLHVHDNCGLEDDHLSPYTGTVRWQDHITALRDIGYNGDISFETFKQVKSTIVPEPLMLPWLKLMASIADYFRQEITK